MSYIYIDNIYICFKCYIKCRDIYIYIIWISSNKMRNVFFIEKKSDNLHIYIPCFDIYIFIHCTSFVSFSYNFSHVRFWIPSYWWICFVIEERLKSLNKTKSPIVHKKKLAKITTNILMEIYTSTYTIQDE